MPLSSPQCHHISWQSAGGLAILLEQGPQHSRLSITGHVLSFSFDSVLLSGLTTFSARQSLSVLPISPRPRRMHFLVQRASQEILFTIGLILIRFDGLTISVTSISHVSHEVGPLLEHVLAHSLQAPLVRL